MAKKTTEPSTARRSRKLHPPRRQPQCRLRQNFRTTFQKKL
jgi:hypothetical protein